MVNCDRILWFLSHFDLLILIDIWEKYNLAWIIGHFNCFSWTIRHHLIDSIKALSLAIYPALSASYLICLNLHKSAKRRLHLVTRFIVKVRWLACAPSMAHLTVWPGIQARIAPPEILALGQIATAIDWLFLQTVQLIKLLVVDLTAYRWVQFAHV